MTQAYVSQDPHDEHYLGCKSSSMVTESLVFRIQPTTTTTVITIMFTNKIHYSYMHTQIHLYTVYFYNTNIIRLIFIQNPCT